MVKLKWVSSKTTSYHKPNTVQSIKRHMGTDYKVDIEGKSYTPQELSAMILQNLKALQKTI